MISSIKREREDPQRGQLEVELKDALRDLDDARAETERLKRLLEEKGDEAERMAKVFLASRKTT